MYYITISIKSRKLWRKQIGGKREKEFEIEVLQRLSKIEAKLDDYNNIKGKVEVAFVKSNQNEKDIAEINDRLKWITRTIVAAIITIVVGVVVWAIKTM